MFNKMLILTICLLAVKTVLTMPLTEESANNQTFFNPEISVTDNNTFLEIFTERVPEIVKRAIIIEVPQNESVTEIDPELENANSTETINNIEKRAIITVFEVEVDSTVLPEMENSTQLVNFTETATENSSDYEFDVDAMVFDENDRR